MFFTLPFTGMTMALSAEATTGKENSGPDGALSTPQISKLKKKRSDVNVSNFHTEKIELHRSGEKNSSQQLLQLTLEDVYSRKCEVYQGGRELMCHKSKTSMLSCPGCLLSEFCSSCLERL